MIIPDLQEIKENKAHRTTKYLKSRYPEFLQYLQEIFDDPWASTSELLYRYFNKIYDKPKCQCKSCSKYTRFKDFNSGYRLFCSKKCLVSDPEMKNQMKKARENTNLRKYGYKCNFSNPESYNKCKQTWIEKYGVDNPQKNYEIRIQTQQTCLEKYGVEYPLLNEKMKEKSRTTKLQKYNNPYYTNNQKARQTCLEKYGDENFNNPDKRKNTNLIKYGVEYASQFQGISDKIKNSKRLKTFEMFPNVIVVNNGMALCKCHDSNCNMCDEKQFEIELNLYQQRLRTNVDPCIIRTPLKNISGTSIEISIRNILDKYNIHYIENDRKVLKGKELDIYIPEYKLAIECNGVYWHSLKEPTYHYDKWKKCKDQGIQLLTIWDDQIYNKSEIVAGIVKSHLGIYEHQIGARKCILKEVTSKESQDFLQENHLQGSTNGSIRLGLYYNDELVSLMVFGAKRRALGNKENNKENNKETYELYRYCNKIGWQIQGGASRLFKHFLDSYPKSVIESFSSNDISMGDLYKKLGFELIDIQKGSYWYVDKHYNRHHRYSFRKDVLVKQGYDPNKTEFEITNEIGLMRIYDSGQQKWIYNNKK